MDDGRPVKRAFPAEHWTDVVARCREDVAQARQEAVEAMEAAAAATKEAAAAKRDAADKVNKAAQTVENLSQQNRSMAARIRELEGHPHKDQTNWLQEAFDDVDEAVASYEGPVQVRNFSEMQLEAIRWASALIGLEKMASDVIQAYIPLRSISEGCGEVTITTTAVRQDARKELAKQLENLRTIIESTPDDRYSPSKGHNEFLKGSLSQLPLNTPSRLRLFLNRRQLEVIKSERLI